MAAASNGELYVGGWFEEADSMDSPYWARWRVCPVDFNCDEVVDFGDYLEFLNLFDAGDPRADLNHDGAIDFVDYLAFLNAFDAGC